MNLAMLVLWLGTMVPPEQVAVAVWDHDCIDKIEVTKDSKIEAPLKDGEPDRAHAFLTQGVVKFKPGCTWHIEVRHQ